MANTKPNSSVTFYKTRIQAEKNVYVDSLDDYLQSTTTPHSMTCQYIKHDLTYNLKVDLPQEVQTSCQYNYAKVVNTKKDGSTEEPVYYFIAGITPVSQKACVVSLAMDTINTLGQGSSDVCNPRNFLPQTLIQREHRDRFLRPLGTWTTNARLVRKVDEVPEGLNSPQIKVDDTTLTAYGNSYDWYLIYKSDTVDPDGIACDMVASSALYIGTDPVGASKTYQPSDFDVGIYYYLTDVDNPGATFVLPTTPPTTVTFPEAGDAGFGTKAYVFNRESLEDNRIRYKTFDNGTISGSWTYRSNVTINKASFFRTSASDSFLDFGPYGIQAQLTSKAGIYIGSAPQSIAISAVDRTDSRITKIIKYPYCPVEYTTTIVGGQERWTFPTGWTYRQGCMRWMGQGIPTLLHEGVVEFDLDEYRCLVTGLAIDTPKNIDYESKLYNSEIYTIKLQYDSFNSEIKMEDMPCNRQLPTSTTTAHVSVDFKPTSTVNSKFVFKWEPSNVNNIKSEDDYSRMIFSTRNNEESIFNNEYLNYIKNGYNYDKKSQSLQATQAIIGAVSSVVGTGFNAYTSWLSAHKDKGLKSAIQYRDMMQGFLSEKEAADKGLNLRGPVTTEDYRWIVNKANLEIGRLKENDIAKNLSLGLINTTISGAIGAANAITGAVISIAQNKNSLEQKQAQLQAQAASVAGTDDIDLLSYYSSNRLHLYRYQPRDYIRNQLWKMFDLTGYNTQTTGIPDVDSRKWYNYIQCTPVISTAAYGMNVQNTWVENLKERYGSGVTVLHKNVLSGSATWDFDQTSYENWESWLIDDMT